MFCVLMSSGDYLDAFERLLKLNLKDKQERSIVHVLVHCCAQEKAHNPFYAHLAEKLCGMGHHFKFTFQLTFWDRLKLMKGDEDMSDPMPLRKVANLARLLAHLLVQFSMSLAILKVVEWDRLTDTEISFLRMVFLRVILDEDGGRAIAVFERIGKGAGGEAKAARPGMHKVKATRRVGGWVGRRVDG